MLELHKAGAQRPLTEGVPDLTTWRHLVLPGIGRRWRHRSPRPLRARTSIADCCGAATDFSFLAGRIDAVASSYWDCALGWRCSRIGIGASVRLVWSTLVVSRTG